MSPLATPRTNIFASFPLSSPQMSLFALLCPHRSLDVRKTHRRLLCFLVSRNVQFFSFLRSNRLRCISVSPLYSHRPTLSCCISLHRCTRIAQFSSRVNPHLNTPHTSPISQTPASVLVKRILSRGGVLRITPLVRQRTTKAIPDVQEMTHMT